mmetsp:Transcript_60371/g.178779  ORF Transcript_60371/g.178779 Transcript_60371/m.178779 type:complete len:379 (-) Transcript_60371:391-1527(-)
MRRVAQENHVPSDPPGQRLPRPQPDPHYAARVRLGHCIHEPLAPAMLPHLGGQFVPLPPPSFLPQRTPRLRILHRSREVHLKDRLVRSSRIRAHVTLGRVGRREAYTPHGTRDGGRPHQARHSRVLGLLFEGSLGSQDVLPNIGVDPVAPEEEGRADGLVRVCKGNLHCRVIQFLDCLDAPPEMDRYASLQARIVQNALELPPSDADRIQFFLLLPVAATFVLVVADQVPLLGLAHFIPLVIVPPPPKVLVPRVPQFSQHLPVVVDVSHDPKAVGVHADGAPHAVDESGRLLVHRGDDPEAGMEGQREDQSRDSSARDDDRERLRRLAVDDAAAGGGGAGGGLGGERGHLVLQSFRCGSSCSGRLIRFVSVRDITGRG